MSRSPTNDEPPARIAGAGLGAVIPLITLLGLSLLFGSLGWIGLWTLAAAVKFNWGGLMWLSLGLAILGFLIGFHRLLALISPLWDAITWLWNRDRAFDQRMSEVFFDYFFSILFVGVLLGLIWLCVLR